MSTKASEIQVNSEVAESFETALKVYPTVVSDKLRSFYAENPDAVVFGDDGTFNVPLQVVVDVFKSTGSKSKTAKLFGKKPSAIRSKLIKAQAKGLIAGVFGDTLSAETQRVLDLLAEGKSIKTMAETLGVKDSSVRRHITTLTAKGYVRKSAPRPALELVKS